MRRLFICLASFFLAGSASALAQKEPVLKSSAVLGYPPIARAARVSGEVTVEFSIDAQGNATSVTATDGPKLLRGGAESFVQSWKFDLEGAVWAPETKYRTTIRYKAVEGIVDPRTDPGLKVHSDSFHHFEASILVGDIQLSNCPTGADEDVPAKSSTEDFVEIERSACMGSCPDYSVKVQADGAVIWHGLSSVRVVGEREDRIDQTAARNLLEKFRTKEFWSYCGDYSRGITDASGTSITVKLGSKQRSISDYAESSPEALQGLLMDVDTAADSHRWRHGDPAIEPITRIDSDGYLPKPGVTPLMLAAARNKVEELKALIDGGADLKQADASGWTALMYAASVSSDFPVQLLLKAGADPNQGSLRGDTPLMVNALSSYWNDDLVRAGARVNAKNKDGRTALMILVTRHEVDQIRAALNAGADARIKDAKGRTALDYLILASCGKSPLYDPITDGIFSYSKCTAFDPADLRKAEKLLLTAMARQE